MNKKLEGDAVAIGARIKARREELGIPAVELAETAGVTPTAFWKWESGKHVPGALEIEAIARHLRTTVTYLLYGERVPPLSGERLYAAFRDFLQLPGIAAELEAAPWKREILVQLHFPPGQEPNVRTYIVALSALAESN